MIETRFTKSFHHHRSKLVLVQVINVAVRAHDYVTAVGYCWVLTILCPWPEKSEGIYYLECYHWFFTEITYMGNLNKFAKPSEWIKSESRHIFYKIDLSALIFHLCEKSIIAHTALVLKDAFAPQFASGMDTLIYKMSLVRLCIKPRLTCQHLRAVSYRII